MSFDSNTTEMMRGETKNESCEKSASDDSKFAAQF